MTLLFLVACALSPAPVQASFPGRNGEIVFVRHPLVHPQRVFAMRPDGSHQHPIADIEPSFGASFSSDGRTLVSPDCRSDPCRLALMDPDGGHLRYVPHAPPAAFDPAFSPDGRWLVFDDGQQALSNGQQPHLYRMRIDGSGLRRIGNGREPEFSPRAGRIAYWSDPPAGGRDVWSARPDGSDARALTDDAAGEVNPSYSPDGRLIAFAGLGIVSWDQIYVMRSDGTHVRRLTNDHAHDNRPVFSPDGRKIAFVADGQHTHTDIYVMDRDGTHRRKLTSGPAYEYLLDWQPLPPRPRG